MGWNVVIGNHRGLGGVPITSDLVYNCGWANDIREVCNRLHHKHPKAPLFLNGTSIGANILVKYLGENGDNAPVSGAAAISNPWDFLIGDRFIRRTLLRKFYDKALTLGLEWYSQLHQHCYSRLANWDGKIAFGITMLPVMWASLRLWTRFIGAQAAPFMCAMCVCLCFVSVPWMIQSAPEKPFLGMNVFLATTKHGSHLAFFEGISASRIWWERAADEFFKVRR